MRNILVIAAVVLAAAITAFLWDRGFTPADPEAALAYFTDSVTHKVQTSVEGYEQLGLGGGVDGFHLLETYPDLLPQDFTDVAAYQGEYSVNVKGELVFTGHAASNSAVLLRDGMQTLLNNLAERFGERSDTKSGVDDILARLE